MVDFKFCKFCHKKFYRGAGITPGAWWHMLYCCEDCRKKAKAIMDAARNRHLKKLGLPNMGTYRMRAGFCEYYPRILTNSAECQAGLKLSCPGCRHQGRENYYLASFDFQDQIGDAFCLESR
jgi:hypothetical protein